MQSLFCETRCIFYITPHEHTCFEDTEQTLNEDSVTQNQNYQISIEPDPQDMFSSYTRTVYVWYVWYAGSEATNSVPSNL